MSLLISKRFLRHSTRLFNQQQEFLHDYRVRSTLERLIHQYASKPLPQFSLEKLYKQSIDLDKKSILINSKETIDQLLIFNARRLQSFRALPYLVVLNPSISESYNMYLKSMSLLIASSFKTPRTIDENLIFTKEVVSEIINIHSDALPGLSKGFGEVLPFIGADKTKKFLDSHLVERIRMRLIAHQHVELTNTLETLNTSESSSSTNSTKYVKGGKYNGVIKLLDIESVIKKNAELVNDLFLMKYDQSIPLQIDYGLNKKFWKKPQSQDIEMDKSGKLFPYIEYHLDYILTEAFKNSFRAQIENGVFDPVNVTISIPKDSSFLEMRIRDKGKGIPKKTMNHIYDYSYSTYESGEGDSYKTLNVPPGLGGNTVAGMGYGLPLSKNYIEVFNETQDANQSKGSLSIQTYPGWGTDLYIKAVGI